MYKYYCKDSNCPGHTKSWERCCDMRAFSGRKATASHPVATSGPSMAGVPCHPVKERIFA